MKALITQSPIKTEHSIQKAIIGIKGIYDCFVKQKTTQEGITTLIIYFLSTQIVSEEDIKNQITDVANTEFKMVQLTSFPIDFNGEMDVGQLNEIPIFNEEYLLSLAEKLKTQYTSLKLKSELKTNFEFEANNQFSTAKDAIVLGGAANTKITEGTLSESLAAASITSNGITLVSSKGNAETFSYNELFEKAKMTAGALHKLRIRKQTPIIMQLPDMAQYIEVFWGSILKGIPAIPMAFPKGYSTNMPGANKLLATVKQFSESVVICEEKNKEVISAFLKANTNTTVTVLAYEDLAGTAEKLNTFDVQPDDIAVYLMTSGSTGAPKLVPQTHRRIINRCAGTIAANTFTREDISLNWLPLDHVGGIIMFHVRDVVSRCFQIQVDTNYILQKPLRWMELCSQFRVNLTWAPNFAFNLISSFKEEITNSKLDLSTIRFIMNSGEQIIASQVHKFLELFKPFNLSSKAVFPAWGMSETCSAVLFNKSFDLSSVNHKYVSVGKPIAGVDARIVNESNELLKEGQHGRLQVKGACILESYYNRPDVNTESFTDNNWFDTGDIAFIQNGEVAVVGRNKDILIINGYNLSCHEIEEYIDTIKGVEPSSTAVVPFRDGESYTDSVAVFYHTKEQGTASENIKKVIRREVSMLFGFTPSEIISIQPNEIPRTSIGKIQKGKLTKMLEEGSFNLNPSVVNKISGDDTYKTTVLERIWKPKKLSEIAITKPRTALVFPVVNSSINFEILPASVDLLYAVNSDNFCKISDNEYGVNQDRQEDFIKLLEDIFANNIELGTVIIESEEDKKSTNSSETAEKNALRLLFLVKALSTFREKHISLILVSRQNQQVTSDEKTRINASAQIGMLHAIHEEIKWISCKHIDVNTLIDSSALFQEATAINKFDREVVYRENKRFVSRLSETVIKNYEKSFIPKDNETYLITGGLGGIAITLAMDLLEKAAVKLVLLGRSAFADLNQEKQDNYNRIKEISADVTYVNADLNDYQTLKQRLNGTTIDGIFHLAADFKMKAISNFSAEEFRHQIQTKVKGSFNLYDLACELKISNFINFSSVNGYFGGVGVIAYSAANRFQEALVKYATQQNAVKVWNMAWSIWENTGLGKKIEFPELAARKGFDILKAKDALKLMYKVLSQGVSNSFIGINKNNLFMQPYLSLKTAPLREIEVSGSENNINTDFKNYLKDEFEIAIPISKIVLTKEVQTLPDEDTETKTVFKESIEDYVTSVFMEVLKIDSFSRDDSFFDLGGNSLILPQVYNKIEEKYQCGLTIVDLFQHRTVDEISSFIGNKTQNLQEKQSYETVKGHVTNTWVKLLNLEDINDDENLFDLGLNSLLLPQAQSEINEKFNIELSVVDFFQYSSINELIGVICEKLQIEN
ncbi:SDR family NAD(P)-dependent oxidoreductase [Aquimarina agarivorans]|uniref:SDR family NAD(P)-dependent oxidoreductase n=1 Tax=Aquimarina agarivorans TaxID=980584 RepID=UPI000248FD0F|nr:SDR family NAD(P)-dependent oxidoreductase [Aquimarina agarivorans]